MGQALFLVFWSALYGYHHIEVEKTEEALVPDSSHPTGERQPDLEKKSD